METFEGYITCLSPDLKVAFETGETTREAIRYAINSKLFKGVRVESMRRTIVTPKSNIDTKHIVLDEAFLSYIWSFCCFMLGVTDIYHEKAMEVPLLPVVRLSDSPRFAQFNRMLAWGRSLQDQYSLWPKDLPTPCQQDDLTILSNRLWLYVIRFFMYHELGHLTLHSGSVELIRQYNRPFFQPTIDQRAQLIAMELEADNYALDLFLASDEGEYDRYLKYLGAATAYLASFFLLSDPDTRGYMHPDLDERFRILLGRVKGLEELRYNLLLNAVNVGLQSFMALHDDYFSVDMSVSYDDFETLKSVLFKMIDELKKKYDLHRPFVSQSF